jgi:hypothetical protein
MKVRTCPNVEDEMIAASNTACRAVSVLRRAGREGCGGPRHRQPKRRQKKAGTSDLTKTTKKPSTAPKSNINKPQWKEMIGA